MSPCISGMEPRESELYTLVVLELFSFPNSGCTELNNHLANRAIKPNAVFNGLLTYRNGRS